MLVVLSCANCGKEGWGVDDVSLTLELGKTSHCNVCHHTQERKEHLIFCTPKCLAEFMNSGKLDSKIQSFRDQS